MGERRSDWERGKGDGKWGEGGLVHVNAVISGIVMIFSYKMVFTIQTDEL